MRLLLDECVPRRLGREFVGHEITTVQEQGWSGIKNGELLALAAPEFDVFLTVDQGIPFQQNLVSLEIAVITMASRSNDISDLRPLIPAVLETLGSAKPGMVVSERHRPPPNGGPGVRLRCLSEPQGRPRQVSRRFVGLQRPSQLACSSTATSRASRPFKRSFSTSRSWRICKFIH